LIIIKKSVNYEAFGLEKSMDEKSIKYNINCEWGVKGIERFKQDSDVIVIVDVLSFSTSVDIALSRGAVIYPYRFTDETALLYAKQVNAELASSRRSTEVFSLSPVSLLSISFGEKLVLPSPNGSELSFVSGSQRVSTIAACLRNSKASAEAAMNLGERITVIPAGEKWKDGSMRFAIEDLVAAGAIISNIKGELSPEAELAVSTFRNFETKLYRVISDSASGIELFNMGFPGDVELASELNVSETVPLLNVNLFENYATRTSILSSRN
jgi:2-phosphosulfolactate phosphatase